LARFSSIDSTPGDNAESVPVTEASGRQNDAASVDSPATAALAEEAELERIRDSYEKSLKARE
jgi:hypothetical protein